MIVAAAKKYKINFSKSFLVGDRASDIEAGKKVGCRLIFINRNEKTLVRIFNNCIFDLSCYLQQL
jgi:D-glycero-D-manno-heptose 1,7-bisphosphate phosphatase